MTEDSAQHQNAADQGQVRRRFVPEYPDPNRRQDNLRHHQQGCLSRRQITRTHGEQREAESHRADPHQRAHQEVVGFQHEAEAWRQTGQSPQGRNAARDADRRHHVDIARVAQRDDKAGMGHQGNDRHDIAEKAPGAQALEDHDGDPGQGEGHGDGRRPTDRLAHQQPGENR